LSVPGPVLRDDIEAMAQAVRLGRATGQKGRAHFIAAGSQVAVSGMTISSAISRHMLPMKGRQPTMTSPIEIVPRLMPWMTSTPRSPS
jgi:hypothetical protein